MKKPKTDTYEATFRGRKTRVTIPPRDEVEYTGPRDQVLAAVLRDNLTSGAMAVLADAINTRLARGLGDRAVRHELAGLATTLMTAVGNRYQDLLAEAGI